MAKRTKYWYKDFGTRKMRFTYGKFGGWTDQTGPMNVRYAIFVRKASTIYVPEYLLPFKTRDLIAKTERSKGNGS